MGTYLSTPITEKNAESGESLDCPSTPVAWGVVDMQGWRKSMEDSHVAQTDIDVPAHHFEASHDPARHVDAKVFGVFDGHGGPEVARFCQLYLINVLTQQPTWQFESKTNAGVDEGTSPEPGDTDIGQALIAAFHSLDRMIHSQDHYDELVRLRAIKPDPKERRTVNSIPPVQPLVEQENTAISDVPKEDAGDVISSGEALDIPQENDTTSDQTEAPAAADTAADDDKKDDDSHEAVGKEEAAENDQNLDEENENDADDEIEVSNNAEPSPAGKVTSIFQRFLNLSAQQSGQIAVNVNDGLTPAPAGTDASTATQLGPRSANRPAIVQNGRLTCNLPDHPIHAGATAIIAVIVGRTLTVANAGDSRAVLCRGGDTIAMSFDHKPFDNREISRITMAGGFVNQFGRVNGNLNLSRSIGDLKYKQGPIPPSEQMITAEPDITQILLEPRDEFVILGCDGIWDCLTNEQAVEYVRQRIETKTPAEIGTEMLDDIISVDPRVTQGIGGDNMTIMVVDLQPHSRQYRESNVTVSPSEE